MAQPKSQYEQLGVKPDDEEQGPQLEAVEPQAPEPPDPEDAVDRPEWLPEKFKTEEDFAKSYTSLEDRLRQESEARKDLEQQLTSMQEWAQQAQQPQQQQQTADPMLAQYASELEAARDNGDALREAELAMWLNQYTLQQAWGQMQNQAQAQQQPQQQAQNELIAMQARQTLEGRYPDWEEKQERIAELLEREPDLLTDQALETFKGTVNALDRAYKLVEADDLRQKMKEFEEQGVSAADFSRARKLQAQTLSGATGRPGEQTAADKQVAEMQASLRGSSWEHGQASPAK